MHWLNSANGYNYFKVSMKIMNNPFSLENKTILITGASAGIGRSAAVECAKLGAKLILLARNEEKLNQVLSILDNPSIGHTKVVADLTDTDAISKVVNEFPVLDGLVSNAGIGNTVPVQFYSVEAIQKIYKVNVIAPMMLVKNLLKNKKLAKPSSVVFTSSAGGVYAPGVCNGIYDSSKNALHAYMRVAALEMGKKGIRFNTVNPGMVETDFIHGGTFTEEQLNEDKKKYVLGRYGRPEDVAYGIVYLLSDASSWVTGTDLKIDGGRTLY